MKSPLPRDETTCDPMSISRRFHRYVVDASEAADDEAADVIVSNYAEEKYDCKPIGGEIRKRYMFRATPQLGKAKIEFKTLPCWCDDCMVRNGKCQFAQLTGKWSMHNILPKVVLTTVPQEIAAIAEIQAEECELEAAYNQPVRDPSILEEEIADAERDAAAEELEELEEEEEDEDGEGMDSC
jgi:hypothetical protein